MCWYLVIIVAYGASNVVHLIPVRAIMWFGPIDTLNMLKHTTPVYNLPYVCFIVTLFVFSCTFWCVDTLFTCTFMHLQWYQWASQCAQKSRGAQPVTLQSPLMCPSTSDWMQEFCCAFRKCTIARRYNRSLWQNAANPQESWRCTALRLWCW